jgi:hypothetical protein
MTTDERLGRIERAMACMAVTLTRLGPLRGPHADAMRAIAAEVNDVDAAAASQERAEALRAELAELEAA